MLKFPEFEELLVEWLRRVLDQNICVTGELVRVKHIRTLENMNQNKPENEKVELNFIYGRLYMFKKRNSFRRYRLFMNLVKLRLKELFLNYKNCGRKYQNIQSTMFLMPTNFGCPTD